VGYAVTNERVASALRKTQLPFGVSSVAEQAALASLANRDALMRRVQQLKGERARVSAALTTLGVEFPPSQGNFVWLPLGEAAVDFAAECESAGLTVRAFAGDGVRVTVGEPEANDRIIEVLRQRR
jgi:histidinol-phosphate aminotransferase